RAIGEHHAPAVGRAGGVLLDDGDLASRVLLLHQQGEVQPGRPAPQDADLHSGARSARRSVTKETSNAIEEVSTSPNGISSAPAVTTPFTQSSQTTLPSGLSRPKRKSSTSGVGPGPRGPTNALITEPGSARTTSSAGGVLQPVTSTVSMSDPRSGSTGERDAQAIAPALRSAVRAAPS